MTLSTGTRLGPYEITAAIGAGGMGEVYRGLPPDADSSVIASPDGRTLYYGAQQTEANIWMVRRPGEMK